MKTKGREREIDIYYIDRWTNKNIYDKRREKEID